MATYWKATDASAENASVVTMDSPVAGLNWADWDDAYLSKILAKVVSRFNCDSVIPFELNPSGQVVTAMSRAAAHPGYYNIASKNDLLIHHPTAHLASEGNVLLTTSGDQNCTAQTTLKQLAQAALNQLVPGLSQDAGIDEYAGCVAATHGAVLHDPEAVEWIGSIAEVLLSEKVDVMGAEDVVRLAAVELTGGQHVATAAECTALPAGTHCITNDMGGDESLGWLTVWGGQSGGEGSYELTFGRGTDGRWMYLYVDAGLSGLHITFWGEGQVCSPEGLRIRSGPDATFDQIGNIPNGTVIRPLEFVATSPGSYRDRQTGSGWLRIAAPSAGWVSSDFVEGLGCRQSTPVVDHAELERIIDAAALAIGGTIVSVASADACGDSNCVEQLRAMDESGRRGLARLKVFLGRWGDRIPTHLNIGRSSNGIWKLAFVPPYDSTGEAFELPGHGQVCSDGRLNVRAEPALDSMIVGQLRSLELVYLEEFVQTGPGLTNVEQHAFVPTAEGWFRISNPQAGWVFAPYMIPIGINCYEGVE